ncbi:glucosidase II beta subunit-like protein-domain-containing protein [Microdochium trichocladiopsis]|uniref:Glucosidase 2 subunit beta n=1 Tax=Microdochium trichocladiopsis TaxID=1682393 RepID=A0A9P8XWW0_9PEZI|nr:glucosidase II beta subunit-like protein-domain-containing protein [Microdochium trichocladiopsis]KAH7020852.1 glucosidase II beta subunit-like protein-domain-containing protein [Microdochium trichocladiopsis]
MQRLQALACLGAAAHAATAAAANSAPRGVSPEFVKYYGNKDTFTCISHPSIIISSSKVNDNSCDCPDGSDEPGTSACAYLDPLSPPQPLPGSVSGTTNTSNALPGFWCENKGHIGSYVPFIYVNDGVCDYELCCDGSEEFSGAGGVKCPNKCAEIGKEWRRIDQERRDNLERANKRRRTMVKEAKELRRRVEAKIESLTNEIKDLEIKENDLKNKLLEAERQERGRVVHGEGVGKLGVLTALAKTRISELRDVLGRVNAERSDYKTKAEELESILAAFKEEYNPNFNDEGVKKAVRAWEDYAAKKAGEYANPVAEEDINSALAADSEESGINWSEFEDEEMTDTDILYSLEAYLPGPLRDYLHGRINSLRTWLIENGMLADNASEKSEGRLVKAAREQHQAVERDLQNKNRELADQENDLSKDYGKDDIFRHLKGKCVSTDAGEYTYELCWLGQTTQKSKKGSGNSNMGRFDRIEYENADEEDRHDGKGLGRGRRMVLKYENGAGCWNGPNRRTDVWLGCAENEELWRVSEMEKCVYRMEVGTPAACEEAVAEGQQGHGKDEL